MCKRKVWSVRLATPMPSVSIIKKNNHYRHKQRNTKMTCKLKIKISTKQNTHVKGK